MESVRTIFISTLCSMPDGIGYILVWIMVKGPEILNSLAQAFQG